MEIDMQIIVNEVVATKFHTPVNNVIEETIEDEDNVDFIPAEGMEFDSADHIINFYIR